MIIANALKRLFDGANAEIVLLGTPKTATLKFWYGDQKELLNWITNQNTRSNPDKYPLIWYVLNEYTEFQGWYTTEARIVIMQDTRIEQMNDWRNDNSYEGILEPVWQVVKDKLITNGNVEVFGSYETCFKLQTIPNYGITPQTNSMSESSNQSTSIDLIDCIVIDFKMRINAKCIN